MKTETARRNTVFSNNVVSRLQQAIEHRRETLRNIEHAIKELNGYAERERQKLRELEMGEKQLIDFGRGN